MDASSFPPSLLPFFSWHCFPKKDSPSGPTLSSAINCGFQDKLIINTFQFTRSVLFSRKYKAAFPPYWPNSTLYISVMKQTNSCRTTFPWVFDKSQKFALWRLCLLLGGLYFSIREIQENFLVHSTLNIFALNSSFFFSDSSPRRLKSVILLQDRKRQLVEI